MFLFFIVILFSSFCFTHCDSETTVDFGLFLLKKIYLMFKFKEVAEYQC